MPRVAQVEMGTYGITGEHQHLEPHRVSLFRTLPWHALKFAGRVERFANEKGRNNDDVRTAPTIARLLREKLLDFEKITRAGG